MIDHGFVLCDIGFGIPVLLAKSRPNHKKVEYTKGEKQGKYGLQSAHINSPNKIVGTILSYATVSLFAERFPRSQSGGLKYLSLNKFIFNVGSENNIMERLYRY